MLIDTLTPDLIPGTPEANAAAGHYRNLARLMRRNGGDLGPFVMLRKAARLDGALVTQQLPARKPSRIAYRKRQRAAKRHA